MSIENPSFDPQEEKNADSEVKNRLKTAVAISAAAMALLGEGCKPDTDGSRDGMPQSREQIQKSHSEHVKEINEIIAKLRLEQTPENMETEAKLRAIMMAVEKGFIKKRGQMPKIEGKRIGMYPVEVTVNGEHLPLNIETDYTPEQLSFIRNSDSQIEELGDFSGFTGQDNSLPVPDKPSNPGIKRNPFTAEGADDF